MMKQSPREKLAGTSLSLALLSFVAIFMMPVAVPYIFASISIVLAVLSMGGRSTMPRKSRTGFRISIVALILNTALILFAIYYFIQMLHNPELQAQYSKILYQTYGITFKEFLDQLGLSSYAQ